MTDKIVTLDDGNIVLYLGDCLEVMKQFDDNSIDSIVTDPPYPDYHSEKYKYFDGILDPLNSFNCRQFIFWSAKVKFPLEYTAIHIWDKKTGAGSQYERIFERNGQKNFTVFRHYLINSTVAASYTGDTFTGHPSQKPLKLIKEILIKYTKPEELILDPFMGSGTTAIACIQTNRRFIGIELFLKYFELSMDRIKNELMQTRMKM